jgi:hypothetical protein
VTRPVTKREAGWFLLDAPLPQPASRLGGADEFAAALLELNASLPAGCKVALVGASDLRVRAEMPAPDESDPTARTRMTEIEAGFAQAVDQLSLGTPRADSDFDAPDDAPAPELATLCREAGWLFDERSEGTIVVDLGVRGTYVPTLVEARTSGIAVETVVVTRLPDKAAHRAALATLLLRANGAYRMVRASFLSAEDESLALLEAPLPLDANAIEFGRALGSVKVAAQHCATEAQMVADDERLARAYSRRFRSEGRPLHAPGVELSSPAWI